MTDQERRFLHVTNCEKCGAQFIITDEEKLLRAIFEEDSFCKRCDEAKNV